MRDKTDKPPVKRASRALAKIDGPERDEAAEAFDHLRMTVERVSADTAAEMTVMRRSVETALDRFERLTPPIDYSEDMGNLIQQTELLADRVGGVESAEMLGYTPRHFAHAVLQAAEQTRAALIDKVVATIGDAAHESASLRTDIRLALQGRRERRDQNIMLAIAGGVGALLGIILLVVLPRALPFDASAYVAAAIIGKDRWNAGADMMETVAPNDWKAFLVNWTFSADNSVLLDKCRAEARKKSKPQKCEVTVDGNG